ncbi:hypothetical protein H9P43_001642 [Blastocladiella emersonii ATCC 22665]|nr:hypothetical protein H9P43_001642 [Blastocladiella emersonii ATCC 22665]
MTTGSRENDFHKQWAAWLKGDQTAVAVAKAALAQQHSRSVSSLWDLFVPQDRFAQFFHELVDLVQDSSAAWSTRTTALEFVCLCFHCIEVEMVRKESFRLVSIGIWSNLATPERLQLELAKSSVLPKLWKHHQRKLAKAASDAERARLVAEQSWLSSLVAQLAAELRGVTPAAAAKGKGKAAAAAASPDHARFICRIVQLLVELESQLPTRRLVHALLDDHDVLRLIEAAAASSRTLSPELARWIAVLRVFILFEVDEHSGEVLSADQADQRREDRLVNVQRLIFTQFRDSLLDLAMAHLNQLQDPEFLRTHIGRVADDVLDALLAALHVRGTHLPLAPGAEPLPLSRDDKVAAAVSHLAAHASPLKDFRQLPLYPVATNSVVDALVPPLSLQYLSLSDYLFRHLVLYRKESGYAIAADVEEAVGRLRPAFNDAADTTEFRGRSRMALAPDTCVVVHVGRMAAFDPAPSRVELEVKYSTANYRREVAREWDSLSRGEVVFLASVDATRDGKFKVNHVRAGVVDTVLGYDGRSLFATEVIERGGPAPTQDQLARRTLRVLLDRHQYRLDMAELKAAVGENGDDEAENEADIYGSFNVLVRRNRRENNFWAVLDAIRELYDQKTALPAWFAEAFLGYGNPRAVHYSHFDENKRVYFHDTFLDADHLRESFPGKTIAFDGDATDRVVLDFSDESTVRVTRVPSAPVSMFQTSLPPENKIRFTPTQVEAIRSGTSHGLTLVAGPPGTGKTDVTVQLLCNLYHSKPTERILLLTHSNQALNQLFEKLLHLNHIPERHLLRLGHADDELISAYDQYGRVTHFMDRRAALLQQVDALARTMGVPGDHAFSCETAASFFKYHVQAAWDGFLAAIAAPGVSAEAAVAAFPFTGFFAALRPEPALFDGTDSAESVRGVAEACWQHLASMMHDVAQSRAFEVLKTDRDKANLLIGREARIVAMTTTYASLKRRDLLDLGFEFESFVMEEAGTVLEIEAFIPLSLSKRVQRVVLIGDHHQLPPVVQCPDLQLKAESLFVRMLRLGVAPVTLDKQGRSRASICALYQHVYPGLTHLPSVAGMAGIANPGFAHEFQFVDVGDWEGLGEVQPVAHYYQNLGEAEFAVATYQYMRLVGYPAERIVILTTYNGQRALVQEVLSKRCAWNPALFGTCHVTTVDKYQGQQNDFVLLSLVRTKAPGHLADIRRMVVAMSRARLGLYVFGRRDLFAAVPELAPTFAELAKRGSAGKGLALLPKERYATITRAVHDSVPAEEVVHAADAAAMTDLVAHLAQEIELEAMAMDVDDA